MSPEQTAALLVSVGESIRAAEAALESEEPRPSTDAALCSLRSARAVLAALSADVEAALPDPDEPEPKMSTDDPSTCGHLDTFDLPGQKMCQSCGASQLADGNWAVL